MWRVERMTVLVLTRDSCLNPREWLSAFSLGRNAQDQKRGTMTPEPMIMSYSAVATRLSPVNTGSDYFRSYPELAPPG